MGTAMVDISGKPAVSRTARATGRIRLRPGTVAVVREGRAAKGDVLATARVAAALAVKDAPRLVPLCHPLPVERVDVELELEPDGVRAAVTVSATARTGVEMEALCGVAAALLTVWDMTKAYEKDADGQYPTTAITDVRVERKEKGALRA